MQAVLFKDMKLCLRFNSIWHAHRCHVDNDAMARTLSMH